MKYHAEFFTHDTHGELASACGDRSVIVLDGRMSSENMHAVSAMSNTQYFNLSIPAPRRLALMRAAGRADWRAARGWRHDNWQGAFATLSAGRKGSEPVWCSHNGPEFRNERDAHTVGDRPRVNHRGWYTDTDANETAIGIVAGLPHGRYLAGYRWTSNYERVYFGQVFDDEIDAARMADEHARVFAESAREDSERFDRMTRAEYERDTKTEDLRDCLALRREGRRDSDDVTAAIEALRAAREELTDATRNYERGE